MKRLTIQEFTSVPGKAEYWITYMTSLKHEEFEPIKLSEKRVVFIAKESLGVFMIDHDPDSGDPISLFAEITDQDDKVSIRWYTKFRRDWYALLGLSGLIIVITALGYRSYKDIYLALVLAPMLPVVFWAIHRWQERTLLKIIKEKIKRKALYRNKQKHGLHFDKTYPKL